MLPQTCQEKPSASHATAMPFAYSSNWQMYSMKLMACSQRVTQYSIPRATWLFVSSKCTVLPGMACSAATAPPDLSDDRLFQCLSPPVCRSLPPLLCLLPKSAVIRSTCSFRVRVQSRSNPNRRQRFSLCNSERT